MAEAAREAAEATSYAAEGEAAAADAAASAAEAAAAAAQQECQQRGDALEDAQAQLAVLERERDAARDESQAQQKQRRRDNRDSESWLVNLRDSDWDTQLSTGDETFLVDQ